MADLRDFTGKNRKFTGASGITTSSDGLGTGDRVNEKGRLRFNDTTDLLEYYNGTDWKAIDAPPVITGFTIDDIGGTAVTSGSVDNEESGDATIEILGNLFDTTGAIVSFVGSAENISAQTITRNSANKLTVTVTYSDFDISNSPYAVKVTNGSGLSAELPAAISADQTTPTFTNAVDTTYSVFDSSRSSGTITAANLIGASGTVGANPYSITTGSLPTGFTLNTATGDITWSSVSAVGSDTTSTFTVSVTGDDATSTRQFKITVKAPIITSITSTGPGTFSVPTGVSSLSLLMVAGGGSGGSSLGSGGGGGGMLEGTLAVTPGSSIAYTVGAGGAQGRATDYYSGFYGQNTTFGPIPGPGSTASATGGGYGCGHAGGGPKGSGSPSEQDGNQINIGGTGGSGGGTGSADQSSLTGRGGYGNQGPSAGLTGYGNDGGIGGGNNGQHSHNGGGGGGAGGVGGNPSGYTAGSGGVGRISTLSGSPVYYAGGGGGSYHPPTGGTVGSGGSGGGTAGSSSGRSSAASANTGGGTGNGGHPAGGSGTGGPGIIIVSI